MAREGGWQLVTPRPRVSFNDEWRMPNISSIVIRSFPIPASE